jgi:hypothetical protein
MLMGSMMTRFPNHHKLVAVSSCATPSAWLHTNVVDIKKAGKKIELLPGARGYVTRDDQEDPLADFDPFMDQAGD